MDYLKLLYHSFNVTKAYETDVDKFEYLSENIFNFTTYDGDVSHLFGKKALEVCQAINDKNTFEYQKDPENYRWYLLMVNMPFFENRLEWGCSIRGAWWNIHGSLVFEISSCGLYVDDEQLLDITFNAEQWDLFIKAMVEFATNDQNT